MSFDKKQFRILVNETLVLIDQYSQDAANLVLGTAAQESGFGTYLEQLNNGPAKGVFQMEPATFNDIVDNFLKYDPKLKAKIISLVGKEDFNPQALEWHLRLGVIMCRLHYRRVKEALPNTVEGYASYWKRHYNTYKGAGTTEEFIKNYKKYVL